MLKVREAMARRGNNPMNGDVHFDGFFLGGKGQEKKGWSYDGYKKKGVTAIQ